MQPSLPWAFAEKDLPKSFGVVGGTKRGRVIGQLGVKIRTTIQPRANLACPCFKERNLRAHSCGWFVSASCGILLLQIAAARRVFSYCVRERKILQDPYSEHRPTCWNDADSRALDRLALVNWLQRFGEVIIVHRLTIAPEYQDRSFARIL